MILTIQQVMFLDMTVEFSNSEYKEVIIKNNKGIRLLTAHIDGIIIGESYETHYRKFFGKNQLLYYYP